MVIQGYRESKLHLAMFLNEYFNGSEPHNCLGVDSEDVFIININSIPEDFDKEAFIKRFTNSLKRSPIFFSSKESDSDISVIRINPLVGEDGVLHTLLD